MHKCRVQDLGLTDYADAYKIQLDLVERIKCGKLEEDSLLLTEHRDVYTFGRKTKEEIPPLVKEIAFEVERGGEATFHNPGQLVCYPILLLNSDEQDVHLHLRRLEAVVIDTLSAFGIQGERREKATGVWIKGKEKKIASIGVALRSWVTYHGLALNISNDLTGFQKINPCGYEASVMTSIEKETEHATSVLEVKNFLLENFSRVFRRQLI